VAALVPSAEVNRQAFAAANASATTKDRHGKTKRTRTFPKPQGASCLERKIESKTEAAADAGEEKSLDRTSHYRPVDRQILCTSICQPSRQRLRRYFRISQSILSLSRQS
jgi:hypothetical protein